MIFTFPRHISCVRCIAHAGCAVTSGAGWHRSAHITSSHTMRSVITIAIHIVAMITITVSIAGVIDWRSSWTTVHGRSVTGIWIRRWRRSNVHQHTLHCAGHSLSIRRWISIVWHGIIVFVQHGIGRHWIALLIVVLVVRWIRRAVGCATWSRWCHRRWSCFVFMRVDLFVTALVRTTAGGHDMRWWLIRWTVIGGADHTGGWVAIAWRIFVRRGGITMTIAGRTVAHVRWRNVCWILGRCILIRNYCARSFWVYRRYRTHWP